MIREWWTFDPGLSPTLENFLWAPLCTMDAVLSSLSAISYENHVSWTVLTHVGAPVAWGPHIINTAVATLLPPGAPYYPNPPLMELKRDIEDGLDQLEGNWLSEDGIDDENSDDEYHDADEIGMIII
ncbi:hypothetical protein TNCV_404181 [Trichonephila clavipes]|nr:hypothetical protein TNCV_404181 [Trichonephila clavipes]